MNYTDNINPLHQTNLPLFSFPLHLVNMVPPDESVSSDDESSSIDDAKLALKNE